MPKLNEVITVILSSLSIAQHQSNKVSKQFAESYQTDEIMKYFALPNATMSEADITLRYAIKDMVEIAMPHLATSQDISSESRFAARIRAFNIIQRHRYRCPSCCNVLHKRYKPSHLRRKQDWP